MSISRSGKRVALLVETSLGSGREILRGIAAYRRQTDGWRIDHEARSLLEGVPEWLRGWSGDGIIARVQDRSTAEELIETGVPVVDVLGVVEGTGLPLVHVDDAAIARQIASHFESKGFRNFAFYGIEGENWSERRREAFRDRCGLADEFGVLETPRGEEDRSEIGAWLRGLPKPVAVMVCSDQRGLALLEACRDEGIAVPERLAVVGVDNDATLCEISTPPLSSVRGGHGRVGFEAARLLDRLMAGAPTPSAPLFVRPNELVARRSSDVRAIADPCVAEALHFLYERLAEPITNSAVANAVGMSRSLLQRRFREATGTTIRDHLVGLRLERAQSLIFGTNMKLAEVAERSGFRHQEYMGVVFKERLGMTPGEMRRRDRGSPEETRHDV